LCGNGELLGKPADRGVAARFLLNFRMIMGETFQLWQEFRRFRRWASGSAVLLAKPNAPIRQDAGLQIAMAPNLGRKG